MGGHGQKQVYKSILYNTSKNPQVQALFGESPQFISTPPFRTVSRGSRVPWGPQGSVLRRFEKVRGSWRKFEKGNGSSRKLEDVPEGSRKFEKVREGSRKLEEV